MTRRLAVMSMTERQFSDAVVDIARTFGWKCAHFGTAWSNKGWRTPVRYDGVGFVDLVLVHPERRLRLFRELKIGRAGTKRGELSDEQKMWGEWLTKAGADWAVWRPDQWEQIVHQLSDGIAEVVA